MAAPSIVAPPRPRHPRSPRLHRPEAKGRIDLIRLSLCVVLVFNVSHIHEAYPILAAIRPALTLTLLALVAAILGRKSLARPYWIRYPLTKILMGLAAASLASIVFGISQGASFWYFESDYSKVLVGCALLMAAIRSPKDLRLFVWAYVVGTAALVYMALFMFSMVAESNGITRLSGLDTWDANDIGVLLLIGLAFCMLLLRTTGAKGKIAAGIITAGVATAMAHSGSRGGFIGLICVLLAYLASLKGVSVFRRVGVVVAVVGGVTLAAPTGYWHQMNTILNPKEDYNWDAPQGRRELAIRGAGYMMSYPVFGIGVGNFARAEGTISPLAGQQGIRWSAPHNTYIQAGAELGIPGFLLFISLVIGCIVVPWRLRARIPHAWARGTPDERFMFQTALYLPLAAIGFAIPAYFVSFAYADPLYVIVAFTAGLRYCVDMQLGPPTRPAANRGAARRIVRRRGAVRPVPKPTVTGSARPEPILPRPVASR